MNVALPTRSFVRRLERWLIGLVMAAVAYVLEKAMLRSIRRGDSKRPPPPSA